jgi:electron transfer flavoprotein alpha subunit
MLRTRRDGLVNAECPTVLVYLGKWSGGLATAERNLLQAAAGIGPETAAVLIAGTYQHDDIARSLAEAGIGVAYVAEAVDDDSLLLPAIDALQAALDEAGAVRAVVVPHTVTAREVGARLAVRLGGAYLGDVAALEATDEGLFAVQEVWGGSYTVRSRILEEDGVPVLCYAGNAGIQADIAGVGTCRVRSLAPQRTELPAASVVSQEPIQRAQSGRPELTGAQVVVSGGRGVGSAEGFQLVNELADALGAAVGASRAAVEAGFCGRELQVGQTGAVVSPQVYIALGISGALQHRMGMQTAGTIIAVNRDPDAPIFELADLSVIGDVSRVVPRLLDLLNSR